MIYTPRFSTVMKASILVVLAMFVFSFILSYYEMSGISISHPSENTDLRKALNLGKGAFIVIAFWMLVGYLCKDFKTATIALVISLAINYGIETIFSRTNGAMPAKDLKFYLFSIAGLLPFIIFGLIHFKSSNGLKLILCWAIIWGLGICLNSHGFERMIESLTRIVGWRDPFEIRIPTGETSYRPISIFRLLSNELFLIVKLTIFYWVYQLAKTSKPIWEALHTCSSTQAIDRISYTVIYWGFRILLFVTGLGLVSYIGQTFRFPIDILTILRIVVASGAIIITACIYRNFLVSHFADRESYPGGLFFLLNIPILNIFAWMYSLVNFKIPKSEGIDANELTSKFTELQTKFIKDNRNTGWKIILLVITAFSLLYQLNRAGFRIDGPSRDGAYMTLLVSLITFTLALWYLFNKKAYIPLLVICCANIFLVGILRDDSFLQPTMASTLVNLVLFYGMFYFDELIWNENKIEPEAA